MCGLDIHGQYPGRFRSRLTAAVVHFYDANERWPTPDELKIAFKNEPSFELGDTPRFDRLDVDVQNPTGEFLVAYDAVAVEVCNTRPHGIIAVKPFPKGQPPQVPRYLE